MKRREFIKLVGGAAATWPVVARAQQAGMPVVGYLNSGERETSAALAAAFIRGLSETGYVEGRSVAIEYRFANNDNARLPELTADLVRRRVAVIAGVNSTEGVRVAQAATTTIPIVFSIGGDPVKMGLVASLNRPGGNVTGTTGMANELGPKRLEMVRDLLPDARLVAALVNPSNPNAEPDAEDLVAAAPSLGLTVDVMNVRREGEINALFATLVQRRLSAFVIVPDPLFTDRRQQLIVLANYHKIPAIYPSRNDANAGGLLSYGDNPADRYRQAGIYTGRVLKGEKPADLPIIRPTKFDLVINLKTAKAIGLNISPVLLARADEVIE
jgi:putative ABC transport system substrate-binding protein